MPRILALVQLIDIILREPHCRAELTALACMLVSKHTEAVVKLAEQPQQEGPRNLTPAEAAKVLGTSTRWMYEHAHELECTRRPSPGKLRFDSVGIERLRDSRR